MSTVKEIRRKRIHKGVRKIVSGTSLKPLLSVFRSNASIYAQLIDDSKGTTIASASSKTVGAKGTKTELSALVGKALGEKAVAAGIKECVFDRSGYLYHGRIKALADGAREGGLLF
jgi:large subunit ribosomal protein L18